MRYATRLDVIKATFENGLENNLPVVNDQDHPVLEAWVWLGDVPAGGQQLLRHTTQHGQFEHEKLGLIHWHATITNSVLSFRKYTDRRVKRESKLENDGVWEEEQKEWLDARQSFNAMATEELTNLMDRYEALLMHISGMEALYEAAPDGFAFAATRDTVNYMALASSEIRKACHRLSTYVEGPVFTRYSDLILRGPIEVKRGD